MVGFIVPPGGFAGFAQMTPASRAALSPRGVGKSSGRRRRRKTASSSKRGSSRKRSGGRKLKFGSPAFRKKHGAKMKRNAAKARRAKKS